MGLGGFLFSKNRSDVVESILRRGAGEITALLLKYELWMVILWLQFYKG